jgi:glycosyltransferase involved in cell wall biosynthesis/ADP-heptose:LPS heptosyltransferase
MQKPIAIVTPWFGRELRGGAERHAWELASRLATRKNQVEVITTCCRSHQEDWATNHIPAGRSLEPEGFSIRRFSVVRRNREEFDRINAKLMGIPRASLKRGLSPLEPDEESVFTDELMRSPDLLEHLWRHADDYRTFIFIPYLYFTTLRGLPLVASKAILVPCLHHESYAFLDRVATVFYQTQRLLFISEGEHRLASWLFGPAIGAKSLVAGGGIDFSNEISSDATIDINSIRPFILCLGRQDPGKNTDFLAQAYSEYRIRDPLTDLKLVLAGPGDAVLPARSEGIVNLGSVSEATKNELLRSCVALFNPSTNESYSRVIMEAWHYGRPVAVHRDCLATSAAVSHGINGWIAGNIDEWIEVFNKVAKESPSALSRMGEIGQQYSNDAADWNKAIGRYESAVRTFDASAPIPQNVDSRKIYQVLPNLVPGDAISNEAIWIKSTLKKLGYQTEILALHIDDLLKHQGNTWDQGNIDSEAIILYHHSIDSPITPKVCEHRGPKLLIYHNITPAHFLDGYLPLNSQLCRRARENLSNLATTFIASVGDSVYNAIELSEAGFPNPGVLPLCIDPKKWDFPPDRALMERLQNGSTNILFVGRLSPNKRQEDLILAFAHYKKLDPGANLHLVGTAASSDDLYESCLRILVKDLEIADSVFFTGRVDDQALAAYYLTASLFWSMSEHEGFCVPLIEAMWFDVPVFAYAACAIPETVAGAGNLFSSKSDPIALARRAYSLVFDPKIRDRALEMQRVRRDAFLPQPVQRCLQAILLKVDSLCSRSLPNASTPDLPEHVEQIAVVKLDHIGDVLLAVPVFFSLAMRYRKAKITAVVSPAAADILANNPYITRIITYDPPWYWREVDKAEDLRKRMTRNWHAMKSLTSSHFDLVVNLRSDHSNILFSASIPHRYLLSYINDSPFPFLVSHSRVKAGTLHATQQHRELLRSIGAHHWCDPKLYPSQHDFHRANLIGQPTSSTVVLALGGGLSLKRWSPIKFRELARRLRLDGLQVAIVGSPTDRTFSEDWAAEYGCVDLCGLFTLLELAAYLSQVGCLVANDSAPMHIGAAAKISVVYIMRPLVYHEFHPVGDAHIACMVDKCEQPCKGFDPNDRNGIPTFCHCIQSVSVDQVESSVRKILRQRSELGQLNIDKPVRQPYRSDEINDQS